MEESRKWEILMKLFGENFEKFVKMNEEEFDFELKQLVDEGYMIAKYTVNTKWGKSLHSVEITKKGEKFISDNYFDL
ncbi:hypothetical protein [Mammaliicoccus sciuri]|uniref:hypothetical protein n=1 Tax=Mammaliicoccus sciuri TaxID=1296 RepID=UPI00194EEB44|nr:hypothetical protein [Mammaliicoccus sciuri]MCD8770799.1 hypothetical protein [Mammaliicoccus sciuri]MCJ0969758.1 hypothetical protein [Mammaliicoccus sciuri]